MDEDPSQSKTVLTSAGAEVPVAQVIAGQLPAAKILTDYERLPRPFLSIFALSLPVALALPGMPAHEAIQTIIAGGTNHGTGSILLFLIDAYLFICFWTIYFSSGFDARIFARQSLRTLLMNHSAQWLAPDHPTAKRHSTKDLVEERRKKANTTMTTQAIFIAISVFIISAAADSPYIRMIDDIGWIDHALVIAALSAAICSFTLILISTDAAETMFNTFAMEREDRAIHSLYSLSARLKYYGFVLCFFSLALYVASISPIVGALSIILLLLFGYEYWYPDTTEDRKRRWEGLIYGAALIAINAYILARYTL